MRLRCVCQYVNQARGLVFLEGQVFEPSYSLLEFLLADAPECFEEVEERARKVKKRSRPQRDKMVKGPVVDKAAGSE